MKKIMSLIDGRTFLFQLSVLLFVICGFTACKDSSKQPQTDQGSPKSAGAAPGENGENIVEPKLVTLSMTKEEFDTLVGKDPKKLVFKFCITGPALDSFTLSAWHENEQKYENPPIYLKKHPGVKDTMIGKETLHFGDQKLIKDQIKDRLIPAVNNLPAGGRIFFVPKIGNKVYNGISYKVVYYSIYDGPSVEEFIKSYEIKPLAIITSTNPSPPASAKVNTIDN